MMHDFAMQVSHHAPIGNEKLVRACRAAVLPLPKGRKVLRLRSSRLLYE